MLNVARELRWVDLSLDHWDDIAPMRCAIPVERGSGAMATAIKVGDRFLQPWEYDLSASIYGERREGPSAAFHAHGGLENG